MSSTREALEAALAAHPDDLARHAAYADLLIEEGDPRGEYIRLQLALEDPDLPADRRTAMDKAAAELLRRHRAEWLGPLAEYTRGRPRLEVAWERGWVSRVTVFTEPDGCETLLKAVAAAGATRLLRSLKITPLIEEAASESDNKAAVPVGPRGLLEEYVPTIHTGRMRGVTITSLEGEELFSGSIDLFVGDLVDSGLIARLDHLDLSRCAITDGGAVALSGCPGVPRLKSINLDGNLLSPFGVQCLADVGVTVGPQQWDRPPGAAHHV